MSTQAETLEPDDELALYAIEQTAEGRTLHAIGDELGMTAGGIFRRVTRTAELQKRYWFAREAATDLLESELVECIRFEETARTSRDAKMARVKAAGLQWLIEKRAPHRYGPRLALEHSSPDGSMSPKEAIDASKLSDDALAQLMAARKPATP